MTEFFQSYLFLRTFSIQLQLSPFEPDSFASCLISSEHNALSDEIHCILLKACIHNIKDDISCTSVSTRWSTLDHFTWTEYILPVLNCYRLFYLRSRNKELHTDESISEVVEITDVIKVVKDRNSKGISYISYSAVEKLLVLRCLTTLLLSNENFRQLTDYRAQIEQTNGEINVHTDKGNSLPLFPKGEDGYPEECILCGQGGDLLCCDMCPAVYHQSCLHTNPSDMEDDWACFECSVLDPMNSRLRLPTLKIRKMSISIIGRFIIQNYKTERSNGNCYRMLGYKATCKLLRGLKVGQISSWPWLNYRTALGRAVQYGQYQYERTSPCKGTKLFVLSRSDVLKIKSLTAVFDAAAAAFNVPIEGKEHSSEGKERSSDTDDGSVQNVRSSIRLTILDNTKSDEINRALTAAGNLQLEYVFNPNSYKNRYSNMKSNVYLGMSIRPEECNGKITANKNKNDENLSLSAMKSVKYNASKFNNLGISYRVNNDSKTRIKDSDKNSTKELISTAGALPPLQPLSLPSLSNKIIPDSSTVWPLYGISPVRSVNRFLEVILPYNKMLFTVN
jgi:DDT domain